MQNRSKRRWLNLQIILASIAVTFTIGLWNVFAKGGSPAVSPSGAQPPDPTFTFTYTPNPTATATAIVDSKAPVRLPQVHLLLGGKMYVPPPVVVASSGGDNGNQTVGPKGGGGNNPPPAAPPPAANTGSSKPK
jgi:hypothetical protein